MENCLKKLYAIDPLFRAMVNSRLRDTGGVLEDPQQVDFEGLSEMDELEIFREYAVVLFREHRMLKSLFVENLQVTGKTVGLKNRIRPSESRQP